MKPCKYIFLMLLLVDLSTSMKAQKGNETSIPETIYYTDIDNDGFYEIMDSSVSKKPEPLQGEKQFYRDLSPLIRYPSKARENGIQGVVLLEIFVDENGKVTDVKVKQSVSYECDETAKNAFINASKQGYWPLIINEKATKFKMECPVRFKLEGRRR